MAVASVHALALLLLLATCGALAQRQPTEVSTSVVIVNLRDLEADIGGGRSTCETVVWNSRGLNARKINVVPTIISQGTETTINYYGFSSGYDSSYIQANQDSIRRWQSGLQRCFKAAIDAGFSTIHITPHVDPKNQATGRGLWRNLVKFDPLVKYSGFSYSDVLLAPVANALSAVIKPTTVVEFSVSAEQGLATWMYPKQWSTAIAQTRAITAKGRNAANHLYGVSFNWDKICGCVEPEEPDPIKYNQTYLDRFARFKAKGGLKTIDVEGVKKLLNESDFIGLSAYASLPTNLTMPSMEVSIQTVAFEFQSFGVSLRNLLLRNNKRLIFSEQGLGGYRDGRISPDVPTLAKYPFLGRWPNNGYSQGEDPWQKTAFRDYRRQLYDIMSRWGAQGGGPLYRVDGIYLWNVGTWDIHGVHPSAYNSQGSFGDPTIRQTIKAGNARAYRKKL